MSGKRSYTTYAGRPSVGYKAARMVGGKVLRFNPTRPLAGSSRARAQPAGGMMAAIRRAAEKKGMDTGLTIAAVLDTTNTNGDCFVLNLVQQGAGSWNRIGRKINLESVRIRGIAQFNFAPVATTAALISNTLRMVLVWDKQPSGAAIPTFDTVFGTTGQDGTEGTTFLNPIKFDNMDRFSVLKDWVCSEKPYAALSSGSTNPVTVQVPFDEYIPLKGREVVFLGQTAPMTIADISTGALYLYFRVETNTASTGFVAIDNTSFARIRYTDL